MNPSDDRRNFERSLYSRDVSFSVDGRTHTGVIENISKGGLRVVIGDSLALSGGTDIEVTLSHADRAPTVRTARVRWFDNGRFGAKFLPEASE